MCLLTKNSIYNFIETDVLSKLISFCIKTFVLLSTIFFSYMYSATIPTQVNIL